MRLRPAARFILAVVVAAAAAGALALAGTINDTNAALQFMGFDPDRAALLTALTVEAMTVAVAALVTRSLVGSRLVGIGIGGALFGDTFVTETRTSLAPGVAQGSFDPAGWVVTFVTLALALAVVAWAVSSLALIVRAHLTLAATDARRLIGGPRSPRLARRPIVALAVAGLIAFAVPVFGDMVNFTPDVHMRSGSQGPVALEDPSGQPADVAPTAAPNASAEATLLPGLSQPPGGGSAPAHPILLATRPWLAWTPQGQGSVVTVHLPGPWVDGATTPATLYVYRPAGYAASSRRYPVVYEVPWGLDGGWSKAAHVTSALDSLISGGAIPPSIVVFVSQSGGPYANSECVNSTDGREWYERYVTETVIATVDQQYRTIATPAARALMGFSDGGFCAAMLVLRHPDVFSSSISFSGYYQAAIRSSQTSQAWRPFAGDTAAIAAHSPVLLAGQVPPAVRPSLFLILSADPTQSFFGPQYQACAKALHAAGISVELLPSSVAHAWTQVNDKLPTALQILAERWNALGVLR